MSLKTWFCLSLSMKLDGCAMNTPLYKFPCNNALLTSSYLSAHPLATVMLKTVLIVLGFTTWLNISFHREISPISSEIHLFTWKFTYCTWLHSRVIWLYQCFHLLSFSLWKIHLFQAILYDYHIFFYDCASTRDQVLSFTSALNS